MHPKRIYFILKTKSSTFDKITCSFHVTTSLPTYYQQNIISAIPKTKCLTSVTQSAVHAFNRAVKLKPISGSENGCTRRLNGFIAASDTFRVVNRSTYSARPIPIYESEYTHDRYLAPETVDLLMRDQ